jgi:hypothetical protein
VCKQNKENEHQLLLGWCAHYLAFSWQINLWLPWMALLMS